MPRASTATARTRSPRVPTLDLLIKPSRSFSSSSTANKQQLVILGSGWGGYELLRKVDRRRYDVTVGEPALLVLLLATSAPPASALTLAPRPLPPSLFHLYSLAQLVLRLHAAPRRRSRRHRRLQQHAGACSRLSRRALLPGLGRQDRLCQQAAHGHARDGLGPPQKAQRRDDRRVERGAQAGHELSWVQAVRAQVRQARDCCRVRPYALSSPPASRARPLTRARLPFPLAPLLPPSPCPPRHLDAVYLFLFTTTNVHSCYSATFGIPGVSAHAYFLKDVRDAAKIRQRILECFELACQPTVTDEERRNLLNFVIVGGGPTGASRSRSRSLLSPSTSWTTQLTSLSRARRRRIRRRAARLPHVGPDEGLSATRQPMQNVRTVPLLRVVLSNHLTSTPSSSAARSTTSRRASWAASTSRCRSTPRTSTCGAASPSRAVGTSSRSPRARCTSRRRASSSSASPSGAPGSPPTRSSTRSASSTRTTRRTASGSTTRSTRGPRTARSWRTSTASATRARSRTSSRRRRRVRPSLPFAH